MASSKQIKNAGNLKFLIERARKGRVEKRTPKAVLFWIAGRVAWLQSKSKQIKKLRENLNVLIKLSAPKENGYLLFSFE